MDSDFNAVKIWVGAMVIHKNEILGKIRIIKSKLTLHDLMRSQ